MKNSFAKKQTVLALACALALGVFSATANAQIMDPNETALLRDSQGMPVMSGSGLCWHSAFGPAPAWTAGCHTPVPAPIAQYVAPDPAPAPAPAAAPAPAPVVEAPAAPLPVSEKVSFDADILFDTNKSDLRAEGRDKLDAFIGEISGLESQKVVAIGYADRMGTDSANQSLSEDRVNTVKSYLVSKGIVADRVQTSAKGETQPTASTGECKEANNATNVACMQPDRHVVIEVSGTRLVK